MIIKTCFCLKICYSLDKKLYSFITINSTHVYIFVAYILLFYLRQCQYKLLHRQNFEIKISLVFFEISLVLENFYKCLRNSRSDTGKEDKVKE